MFSSRQTKIESFWIADIKLSLAVLSKVSKDFNPILERDYLKNADFKIYEIDSHNIVPARFVSNKQEYSASTIRRKIYYNIYPFFTEFVNSSIQEVIATPTPQV